MPIRIVVGVNWGDEGKGRMVDYFSKDADVVIRFQGGNNAGHTVVNEFGTFKLHLVPSGIFYQHVTNVLGPGTVINLEAAADELQQLISRGIQITSETYKISDRAIICFPFHVLQDEYEEERLGSGGFGSTKQGIAPVYGDKYLKYGIQVGAIRYPDYLKAQIGRCIELKNRLFENVYRKPPVTVEAMFNWAMTFGGQLEPYVCDTIRLLERAQQTRQRILLEAQLGTLRDIHYGIYPYTTSSCPLSGFAALGAGLFGANDERLQVTGVMKAFSTCVGAGPFVTEIHGELADSLRETAFEYGAKTGRPRRIGHFDAVASRYGAKLQNATELALTKLDCLSGQSSLKICTHYKIGDRLIENFPITPELSLAEPVYEELQGWDDDVSKIRRFEQLPAPAKLYIQRLEALVRVPIKYISVGPERKALIVR
ncbi:adenylosuccinate synthase [candidate division KSB1 bacterium]|nr:adenylosuccinate synthase [candidate division KSB1 bacterium]